jgi:mRNA-degrading endonuclease toxin of MazEF toxin-antitoxin module
MRATALAATTRQRGCIARRTAVIAAITSNLRLAAMPGNVRVRKDEANLPRASVVKGSPL